MATAVALVVTRRGAYLSPDGLAYVGTARGLVDGLGYTSPPGSPPVGNFPPLYSLVLAGVGAFGPDPLTAARFVNPVLFGLIVLVVGLVARRLTGSLALAFAAQVLVAAGVDFLAYATSALSEPLFLLLSMLALAAVGAFLARRRPAFLLAAALLAAAACLTRYVAVAAVAAGAAGLVLLSPGPRRAWRSGFAFAAVAVAPLLGWFSWVQSREGRATNREAVFHAPGADYVVDALRNASTWVATDWLSWPARGVVAAVVVAALAFFTRRAGGANANPRPAPPPSRRPAALAALAALAVAAYLGALVVDRFLFDVTGRLDDRFLLPVHAGAVVLGVWAVRGVDLARSHAVRLGLSAIVGLQVANGALWVWDAVDDPASRPGGFTAPAWTASEVIDQVRALPEGATVFTNQPDALWFHTGRAAASIPEERALLTGEENEDFEAELVAMADAMSRGGVLVYFTATPSRSVFLPTPAELERALPLQRAVADEVAVAYVLRR
ncbi:MAG: phospholipid carrier-dependent glycosyltransferase [Acidimicrobiia bacterium]